MRADVAVFARHKTLRLRSTLSNINPSARIPSLGVFVRTFSVGRSPRVGNQRRLRLSFQTLIAYYDRLVAILRLFSRLEACNLATAEGLWALNREFNRYLVAAGWTLGKLMTLRRGRIPIADEVLFGQTSF